MWNEEEKPRGLNEASLYAAKVISTVRPFFKTKTEEARNMQTEF